MTSLDHRMCMVFLVFLYSLDTGVSQSTPQGKSDPISECHPYLEAKTINSSSIQISWTHWSTDLKKKCRNASIDGYRILYAVWREGNIVAYQVYGNVRNFSTSSAVVTGLATYTLYYFGVKAYRGNITGPLSGWIKKRTGEDAPDCSPQLHAMTDHYTSIYLSWTSLRDAKCLNGWLRGYKVEYRSLRTGSKYRYMTIDSYFITSEVVYGLDKYTWYRFRVLAYTTKDGPWSNASEARTKEDAPDCSPRVTAASANSSTSIRVSWTSLPNTKCINGVLRGYKVAYRLSGTGSKLQYLDVANNSATSVVVRGLDKYTRYRFQVLAYTTKDGPMSQAEAATTKEDEPDGAPEILGLSDVKEYKLYWTKVPENLANGIIIKYEVRWIMIRKGNQEIVGQPATSGKINGSSYTMNGLSLCAQEYSISVRAYTSVGPGPYSTPVTLATQQCSSMSGSKTSSLSTHGVIAIVIAVVLVLIIAIVGVVVYRRRQKNNEHVLVPNMEYRREECDS